MNCHSVGMGAIRESDCGDCCQITVHGDPVKARDAEIADLRAALSTQGTSGENSTGQVYGIIDPDYGRIYTMVRKLAWEEGYAIGLHGSFTRDLDMVAVPWAEHVCAPQKLVNRILQATGLKSLHGDPGAKPHGRTAWTLMLPEFGDPRFVDLSIMAAPSVSTQLPAGVAGEQP